VLSTFQKITANIFMQRYFKSHNTRCVNKHFSFLTLCYALAGTLFSLLNITLPLYMLEIGRIYMKSLSRHH